MSQKVATSPESLLWSHGGNAVSAPIFSQFPEIVQACTSRQFQNSLPAGTSRMDEIRAVCKMLGLHRNVIALGRQEHTNHVSLVRRTDFHDATHHVYPSTDALVSDEPDMALVIQTADCAPLFLYDPVARVIGLAHAGWKGTLARIVQRTIEAMTNLGSKPGNIVSWVGPMAHSCCYEVSEELVQIFAAEFTALPRNVIHEKRHLNLVQINAIQMIEAGVQPENISFSNICTIHRSDQFFSYRADGGPTGRILSVLSMRGG